MRGDESGSGVGDFLDGGRVFAEDFRGFQVVAKEIVEDLHVHGRSGADGGALEGEAGGFVEERSVAADGREVFGGGGGVGYEPLSVGVRDEEVEEEQDAPFDEGVVLFEKGLVLGVLVVLPQVGGQPGSADGEGAPAWAVHGGGDSPEVGVLVEDPAVGSVVFFGDLRALVGELLDHGEEGLGELAEVGRVGGPVVHLGVDVSGVFGIPGGVLVVVPDALEVGGLGSRARGGDEDISAEVVGEGSQTGVGFGLVFLFADVGGEVGVFGFGEVEFDTVVEALVVGDGGLFESVERLAF